MKQNKIIILLSVAFSLFLISCATSTATRYKREEKKETSRNKTKVLPPENFNITPYRTKLNIKGNKVEKLNQPNGIWYEYKTKVDTGSNKLVFVRKTKGFRVQVYSTDNLSKADSVKTIIYSKTNQKSVYIDFDPPFYKVKIGDFLNYNDAKNLSFKLHQIGYPQARVVNDSVNVFK
ncbi:MAG TPA: SPOR domain-containing protein [Ignavibacteria bacterium]|mgnify:CR=1 FL=1|nr:SPOR domain-containing protein [Ignavibacteria bacterium]